jgi:hypothetical protein
MGTPFAVIAISVFSRHSEERSDQESLFSSIVAAKRFLAAPE